MKKHYFLIIAALPVLSAMSGCQEKEGPVTVPDPVLNLPEKVIQAAAEGGVYELSFTIDNPVDGVLPELVPDQDWISDWEVSDDRISITVDPNNDNADRNANIQFVYAWGETSEEVIEDQIVVHQVYRYDYNMEAKFLDSGGFFTGRTEDTPNYCFYISDIGMSEDGSSFQGNGTYYRIDINTGTVPEDYTDIYIPEGTYQLMSMYGESCFYGVTNADVTEWAEHAYLKEGTVTVSQDGDNWLIEAVLTDENGKVHHVAYNGPVNMDLYCNEGYQVINWDVDMGDEIHLSSTFSYVGSNDQVMQLSLSMANEPEGGDYMNPYTILFFELYAPYHQYKFRTGTYRVSSDLSAYTMFPGYVDPTTLYAFGTYAQCVEGNSAVLALISDGTIEVSESNDIYTVKINLLTAEGFSVTGTYVGELEIPNIPGSGFSTLEDDYTVDLSEAGPFTTFSGDGRFSIELSGPFEQDPDTYLTQGTGEVVHFEIMTDTDYDSETVFGPDNGIPSGTYTVASDSENPEPFQYLPGYQNSVGQGLLSGTYYVGGYEAGYISICAPAVDGDLHITNHGDGTYSFEFSFLDDKGNVWDGEWTGEMGIYNFDFNWAPENPNYVERRLAPVEPEVEQSPAAGYELRMLPAIR